MSERIVVLRLYRTLLRLGKKFDRVPASKALIYRTSTELNKKSQAAKYYAQWLDTTLSGKHMLDPIDNISIAESVRNEFRAPVGSTKLTHKIDAAFVVGRKLNSLWHCHDSLVLKPLWGVDTVVPPPGNFNDLSAQSATGVKAALVNSTSEYMPTFERWQGDLAPGMVLLAHPLLQGELKRSLILILEHSEGEGSYGLVLNRANYNMSLEAAVKNMPLTFMHTFRSSTTSYGGPIRRLQYLHNNPHISGAYEVPFCKTPMFAGGSSDDAVESIGKGTHTLMDYAFYAGCCTWSPGQLGSELTRGFWTPLRTQPDLLVSLCNYSVPEGERTSRQAKSFTLGRVSDPPKRRAGFSGAFSSRTDSSIGGELEDDDDDEDDEEDEDEEEDESEDTESDDTVVGDAQTEGTSATSSSLIDADDSTETAPPSLLDVADKIREASARWERHKSLHLRARTDRRENLRPDPESAQLLTAAREAELVRGSEQGTYRVNAYRYALKGLGGELERAFGGLPEEVTTANVEPSDWR